MLKLELLLRRIRGFDAKRMMVYVRDVKKETKNAHTRHHGGYAVLHFAV